MKNHMNHMQRRNFSVQGVSRRTFLAAAGTGVAALAGGYGLIALDRSLVAFAAPDPSPALPGPYQVARVILGDPKGAAPDSALPQFMTLNGDPGFPATLQNGEQCGTPPGGFAITSVIKPSIKAAVYYPVERVSLSLGANRAGVTARGNVAPIPSLPPITRIAQGPFPVLLYAHGFRGPFDDACRGPHNSTTDYTSVDAMMAHVASYGCVCVVPDISWLPGGAEIPGAHLGAYPPPSGEEFYKYAINTRADVLIAYYDHLVALNPMLFSGQLDLQRLMLVGHSTGGPAVIEMGRQASQWTDVSFTAMASALVAPLLPLMWLSRPNLLVLQGTLDTVMGADPVGTYAGGWAPKTLVTIPGANHFGYTDLCTPQNTCAFDNSGTITRDGQQLAGAAYLAALMRLYMLGDKTARPYLSGEKQVEGLSAVGVIGIEIKAEGY